MTTQTETLPVTQKPLDTPWRAFWSAFRENKGAVAGLIVLLAILFVSLFAEFIAPYNPNEQFRGFTLLPPAWADGGNIKFLLGTDGVGRDTLSRLIYGARISLFIGLSVMVFSLIVGVLLGLSAAYFGGLIDTIISRFTDLIMSVPGLLLATLLVAILGPSFSTTIVAVTVVSLPSFIRIVRATALSELTKDYVIAAKVIGAKPLRLVFKTVLPNCLAPLMVQAALTVSGAILEAAALGFLGLGAQPPMSELGSMLSDQREFIRSNPWMMTLPGLAILSIVISINLLGDGLRDALDPKMRRS